MKYLKTNEPVGDSSNNQLHKTVSEGLAFINSQSKQKFLPIQVYSIMTRSLIIHKKKYGRDFSKFDDNPKIL